MASQFPSSVKARLRVQNISPPLVPSQTRVRSITRLERSTIESIKISELHKTETTKSTARLAKRSSGLRASHVVQYLSVLRLLALSQKA